MFEVNFNLVDRVKKYSRDPLSPLKDRIYCKFCAINSPLEYLSPLDVRKFISVTRSTAVVSFAETGGEGCGADDRETVHAEGKRKICTNKSLN